MQIFSNLRFFGPFLILIFCFVILLFTGLRGADNSEKEILIVVDTSGRTLSLYREGERYKTYPIAIGKPDTKTPIGEWAIVNKTKNWDGNSELGTRWLGLNVPWGSYGIHGTNKPGSIGTAASKGCVRMHNQHVEELYELVPVKTRVKIIGERLPISVNRILYPGSAGLEVMQLQDNLKKMGFKPSYMDAHYGPATKKAVRELQAFYGLKVDGVANPSVLYILDLPEEGQKISGGLGR
ncbi:MAG: L,D-transpeptidase family protein [Bacillota bacterium]